MYVPVFGSQLLRGTLCGRWPDLCLWLVVLALADRDGVVDVTPKYIAAVSGLDVEEVAACMRRFCQPDMDSRSQEANGARLVLLDPHRDWGWRVVNHAKYAEKARLRAKNLREIQSGDNAERLSDRRGPPVTAGDRRPPPPTASASTTTTEEKKEDSDCTAIGGPDTPTDWTLDMKLTYPKRAGNPNWTGMLRAGKARLREGHTSDQFLAGARRYRAFCDATGKTGTEFVLQAATFLGPGKPFLEAWDLPVTKAEAQVHQNLTVSQEWLDEH